MIPKGLDALSAIRSRASTRSFDGQAVDASLLQALLSASEEADHLSDTPPRVSLISGTEATSRVLTFVVGSYGLVVNAPHLLAGILPAESPSARVDLGYVLEQIVLETTRLGLGTCWVTGSYDSSAAGDVVSVGPSEVVAAVCALGNPSRTRLGRFHSGAMRRLAGSRRRKALSEMVFDGEWGVPWNTDEADPPLVAALEHSRLAPSATNGQPWRFVVRENGIVLALTRAKPIDAGIVMAHYALAAECLGLIGRWHLRWGDRSLASECSLPEGAVPVGVFA